MKHLTTLLFFLVAHLGLAQQRSVNGFVRNETRKPIAGVSVVLKGTTFGAVTDANGTYRFSIPNEGGTLLFSFPGYQTVAIAIGSKVEVDVTLTPASQVMNEVQTVAFGQQRKKYLTGAINGINATDLAHNLATSPDAALQGRVAGLQITQAGASPGGAVRINIRGLNSVNASNQPLVVIDGVPVLNTALTTGGVVMNPLAEMNQADIESIEVLKDASATVLFGIRGANGVILITTKKGRRGKPQFEIDLQQGISSPTNRLALVTDGTLYLNTLKQAARNNLLAGLFPQPDRLNNILPVGILKGSDALINPKFLADSATLYGTSTDWLRQVLRNGLFQQANAGLRGGTARFTYYLSGGYRKDEGILVGQSLQRLSGRANLVYQPLKNLKIGANVSFNALENQAVDINTSFRYALTSALPVYPIQNADGSYFNALNYGGGLVNSGTNPVFYRLNAQETTTTKHSTNTAYVEYRPLPGWILRGELGYEYQQSHNHQVQNSLLFPSTINSREKNGSGRAVNREIENRYYTANTTLSHQVLINDRHNVGFMLGHSIQMLDRKAYSLTSEGVAEGMLVGKDTARSTTINDPGAFWFNSFFGRFNYGLLGRYLFELGLRADASSRFPTSQRRAVFPAVSVGWILSEEDFMQDAAVNFLKMRASYGLTGNAELGDITWQKAFNSSADAVYGGIQGGRFTTLGNENLRPENTQQANVGLEIGINNNRIRAGLDIYRKTTKGLVLDYSLGAFSGTISNTMPVNLGALQNRGVEFNLSLVNADRKRFTWTTDFNIAFNQNKVVRTYTAAFLNSPYQLVSGTNIVAEGYAAGTYFLPRQVGFDPLTGNELFLERERSAYTLGGKTLPSGNLWDGTINNLSAQNQFILSGKTPYPTLLGGLTNTFTFGKIDLMALLYFQQGNWLYDQAERLQSYPASGQVLRATIAGVGKVGELNEEESRRLQWASNARGFESDRFLHDASFARLKNLSIGYTLSPEKTKNWGLSTLRLYVSAQNLLTFTRWKGWDPEVFRNGGVGGESVANVQAGFTNNDLPQMKSIVVGLKAGLLP